MEMNKSTEVLGGFKQSVAIKTGRKIKLWFVLAVVFCVVGISALVATTVILLTRGKGNSCAEGKTTSTIQPECPEIKKNELNSLFKQVKNTFYQFHLNPESSGEEFRIPFNFTPDSYKHRTEIARVLLKKLEEHEKSVLGETNEQRHIFELFKYFLLHTFGKSYENNYYVGDWLMGPNMFCWQASCSILNDLYELLNTFALKNCEDVEKLIKLLSKYGRIFHQRIRNLKYGVEVGIVPPIEACHAGLNTFKLFYVNVAKHGAKGIFREKIATKILNASFLENVTLNEKTKWTQKYNRSIQESLNTSILNDLGTPLDDLIRYLEDDYITHCPPSNISSGFTSLPLPYVYTNGTADQSKPTNGSLPDGQKYNGSLAYLKLFSYFTTYNITPNEIDELANKRIKELYPQVIQIAKEVTKNNETVAIKQFQLQLSNDEFYYTIRNKSNHSQPHLICNDEESAIKYCPKRWQAMTKWLKSARAIVSNLQTKTPLAFYLTGQKQTVPICPVEVHFNFNPTSAYYSYGEGSKDCKRLATIYIPFFLDKPGPKYEELTVLAHESYPGHHLEVQGVYEHFKFKCDNMGEWLSLDGKNFFGAFTEGWATYVERHVVDKDMQLYKNDLMSKYGMLKHQILAALRAKVDVGLHYLGMKRHEAIALYKNYTWDSDDVINKQITRLQSAPGQGISYLAGEIKLSELREKAQEKLGKKFDVREFHYKVLAQGALPMSYLSTKIEEYLKEKLNESE